MSKARLPAVIRRQQLRAHTEGHRPTCGARALILIKPLIYHSFIDMIRSKVISVTGIYSCITGIQMLSLMQQAREPR
jgi:hypothetical protein